MLVSTTTVGATANNLMPRKSPHDICVMGGLLDAVVLLQQTMLVCFLVYQPDLLSR